MHTHAHAHAHTYVDVSRLICAILQSLGEMFPRSRKRSSVKMLDPFRTCICVHSQAGDFPPAITSGGKPHHFPFFLLFT